MGALFNRQFSINIGGVGIATSIVDPKQIHPTLRVAFRIERTLAKDPSPGEITIYNLGLDTRSFLSGVKTEFLTTTVEVGYSGQTFQIYSGDIQNVVSQRSGVDWITKLQLKDGGKKYSSARVNE